MKLRATATPIATAAPVDEPNETEPATPSTVAVMSESLDARIETAPTGTSLAVPASSRPTVLLRIDACAFERITFVDSEPPPLAATPVPPPATATETATASDLTMIVSPSVACTMTAPPCVFTPATAFRYASTSLSIVLCASERPIGDRDAALPPARLAATAPARVGGDVRRVGRRDGQAAGGRLDARRAVDVRVDARRDLVVRPQAADRDRLRAGCGERRPRPTAARTSA